MKLDIQLNFIVRNYLKESDPEQQATLLQILLTVTQSEKEQILQYCQTRINRIKQYLFIRSTLKAIVYILIILAAYYYLEKIYYVPSFNYLILLGIGLGTTYKWTMRDSIRIKEEIDLEYLCETLAEDL